MVEIPSVSRQEEESLLEGVGGIELVEQVGRHVHRADHQKLRVAARGPVQDPEHPTPGLPPKPVVDELESPGAVLASEVDGLGFHLVELLQSSQVVRGHGKSILWERKKACSLINSS